jgi:putative DNA primase/helicase
MSALDDFAAALAAADLGEPAVIADGRVHRFRTTDDKPGAASGWYVLHLDGTPNGRAGSWKVAPDGAPLVTWRPEAPQHLDPAEVARQRRELRQRQRARAAEQARAQRAAAELALRIWQASQPARVHPYLTRKGIAAHGARICTVDTRRKPYAIRPDLPPAQRPDYRGALLVPVTIDRRIVSLQFIAADGAKRFLSGGRTEGGYFAIGAAQDDRPLYIAEGFGTAATIYELTQAPTVAAFNAGNLGAVARHMRARWPERQIIVAADNDFGTEARTGRNPGLDYGRRAADAIGAALVYPDAPPAARSAP